MTEPTDAGAGPTTSAFSKLKVKMSNLALPTIPSQQAKRQAQEDMAADNRLKSQLQYRHLDTKILLLWFVYGNVIFCQSVTIIKGFQQRFLGDQLNGPFY